MKRTTCLLGTLAACLLLLALACPGNVAPDKPAPPTGLSTSFIGTELAFVVSGADPDQHKLALRFDWNDGDTSAWSAEVNDGDTVSAVHTWHVPGTYYVSAQAQDPKGERSLWSNWLAVLIRDTVNIAPNTPAFTAGPDTAYFGQACSFAVVTADSNGDRLRYLIDWGTIDTFFSALVASGTEVTAEYAWPDTGTYYIRVQAQDEKGAFSAWSPGREIVITDTLKRR